MAHGSGLKAHGEKSYALRPMPVCSTKFESLNPIFVLNRFDDKGMGGTTAGAKGSAPSLIIVPIYTFC